MFFLISSLAPAGGTGPASALRAPASGNAPIAARPPAAKPDRRRKERRLMPPEELPANAAASCPRRASRSVLLISTVRLPLVAVDAIEGLHVISDLITRLRLRIFFLLRGGRSR